MSFKQSQRVLEYEPEMTRAKAPRYQIEFVCTGVANQPKHMKNNFTAD